MRPEVSSWFVQTSSPTRRWDITTEGGRIILTPVPNSSGGKQKIREARAGQSPLCEDLEKTC